MEAKSLSEKIIIDALKQAQLIQDETKKLVEQVKKDGLTKIKAHHDEMIKKANEQKDADLDSYSKQVNRKLEAYNRQIKQEVIISLFEEVFAEIKQYKKLDLLNWVAKLLNHDEISKATMLVAKKDYDRYLEALSTNKDASNLDLLKQKNKKLDLTLKVDQIGFEEGFILVFNEYDLLFNFYEIVKTNQSTLEKKVYKELFGDE